MDFSGTPESSCHAGRELLFSCFLLFLNCQMEVTFHLPALQEWMKKEFFIQYWEKKKLKGGY